MPTETRSHFSYKTGISLLLPESWLEVRQDIFAALYGDPMEQPHPTIGFNVTRITDPKPRSYLDAAELAEDTTLPDYQQLAFESIEVGGYPAVQRTYQWHDHDGNRTIVQQTTFVQVGDLMYTSIATTTGPQAEQHLPIFRGIVDSIRFLPVVE